MFDKMLQEFKELTGRTDECRGFILDETKFNTLDMINRDLLIAQLKAMVTYLSILSIRLGVNGTPENFSQVEAQNEKIEESSEFDAEATIDSVLNGEY